MTTATENPWWQKYGLSVVSEKNARENLEFEVADFDFDTVRSAARTAWEQALSAIVVEGGNADDRKIFYTALYHSMVVPNVVSDVNGEYRRHDMTTGRMPEGRKHYSTFSVVGHFPCLESADDTTRCRIGE